MYRYLLVLMFLTVIFTPPHCFWFLYIVIETMTHRVPSDLLYSPLLRTFGHFGAPITISLELFLVTKSVKSIQGELGHFNVSVMIPFRYTYFWTSL